MGGPGGSRGLAGLPLLVARSLLLAGQVLPAQTPAQRREEEVFLFALRLDQTTLSAAFPGFPAREGFLLPLGELCRLLELGVLVDPARGTAEGFLVDTTRRSKLDVPAGTVEVQGVRSRLDRSRVELHADDIYVDAGLLGQWLPVDLAVARRAAVVTVTPREPLPLQLNAKREREAGRGRTEPERAVYPRLPDPYRMGEVPMVDETLQLTLRTRPEAGGKVHAQSATFATADLLGLSASLYALLDTHEGLWEFRGTAGRRDPAAGLMGPLRATEFAFGEVLNPGLNLVLQPNAGLGAMLSNHPLQQANAFDRHSFQGDLAPGWQVELYRNQALLAFRAARPDGRYAFLNVPLLFGWNAFRLVFYGPQGQRREETVRFDVGENQTPRGAFQYRVVANRPRGAGPRSQVEARWGLSRRLALHAALAQVRLEGVEHAYLVAGLQGFWRPLSASFSAVRDARGGTLEEVGLRTRLGAWSLVAKRDELQGGFASEGFLPSYGQVRSRSSLETSAALPGHPLVLDLGATQDQLLAGGRVARISTRLSTSFRGVYLSNELVRTSGSSVRTGLASTTTGALLASRFFPAFALRGEASYQLNGGRALLGCSLFADLPHFHPFLVRGGITRTLATGDTLVQVGAIKDQGAFSLGLDLSHSSRQGLLLNLTFRVGLGRGPRQGRFHAQAQSLATQGAVSARAFLDLDGDGRRGPGERDLEGVGFLVNGVRHPRASNAQGIAFLTNLGGEADANLAVAQSSLEDPLMRPGTPGFRVTPRPGHVVRVDFPLVLFGEVNGTVFLGAEGAGRELPGLALELVGADGRVLRRVRSAYDGFYTLSDLPPGRYQLRVADGEVRRLGLQPIPPRLVRIERDGTTLEGVDFRLSPLPPSPRSP